MPSDGVPTAWAVLYAITWITGWYGIQWIAFRVLRRAAATTRWRFDDLLLSAFSRPVTVLIVASGLWLLCRLLPLSPAADEACLLAFKVSVIFAVFLALNRLAAGALELYAKDRPVVQAGGGVLRGMIRGLLIGIGGLILLDTVGISITPILASLGIGSLAVALALQDTLANVFAGLYVLADRPIRIGDFVRLESGQEGYVTQIGWRSTRIRMLSNSLVIVPNSKLISSTLTNYYLPDPGLAVLVDVTVHYHSDLALVERVTVEVAKQVMQTVAGGVPTFEPFIRYHTLGQSGIQFTVILFGKEFADQYLIRHELIKRLQARYAHEGIVMPYPTKMIDDGAGV